VILKQIVGAIGIFIGIACIGVSLVGLEEILTGVADGGTYGAMFFLVGVGGFSVAGGRRMLVDGAKGPKAIGPGEASDPESIVLALAAQGGGRVTVAEVAAKSPLTIDEASETVESLTRRGMADAIVTEGGVVVYQVRGLLSPAAKANAIDILEQ
jgi:hypothetical protein